jgi:hypothetical protein
VGRRQHDLATAGGWQITEQSGANLAPTSVSVEEEKWRAAVALPQELYGFVEGEDLLLFFRPLSCARFLSLAIKAVLRASPCARSSIEAGDKLPTPVFEKLGSGL